MGELRDHERTVLQALVDVGESRDYVSPETIARRCPGLARRMVRKDLLHLTEKELVEEFPIQGFEAWRATPSGHTALTVDTVDFEQAEQVSSPTRPATSGTAAEGQRRGQRSQRTASGEHPGQGSPVPPPPSAA